MFAQHRDVVRAAVGFTQFTLVEWTNDGVNLTENVPTLVVGDMKAALTFLANPEDIRDAVDPAVDNVEEIRTRRPPPPWVHG